MTVDYAAAIRAALTTIDRLYDLALNPSQTATRSQIRLAYQSKPPVSVQAVHRRRQAHDLVHWLAVTVNTGRGLQRTFVVVDVHEVVPWLLPHADWIGEQDFAATAALKLATAASGLNRLVAPGVRQEGACVVCGSAGRRSGESMLCDGCSLVVDGDLPDQLLYLAEMPSAAGRYGHRDVRVETLRTWAKRGLLVPYGRGPGGRLFLVGDVLAQLDAQAARQARRKTA